MSSTHVRGFRVPSLFFVLFTFSLLWPNRETRGQGAPISTDTKSLFLKSNQSKVFYHDGKWWAIAHRDSSGSWYIWKFNGGAWASLIKLEKSSTLKYDAVVNATTDKLYVMGSHASAPEFRRFIYSSGSWSLDAGFPINPGFTNSDGNNPVSLVQAKNGDLWIFRIDSNKLQAKKSIDGGATWSAVIDVKTGLTVANGTTDAVVFTSGGNNFVGVAYGEADNAGTKFGFLRHQDGAADNAWTDETASLTYFGAERGNNQIGLTADGSNNLFLLTKNGNATGSDPRNTLYKRSSAGAWTIFKVNTSVDWKSPAVVFDAANNRLYVMGVRSSSPKTGEYKTCSIGLESTLEAEAATTLFSGAGATFAELSAPAGGTSVDVGTGLMMCADNNAAKDIWYNHLAITSTAPVTIGAITASPTNVNANAAYTIPLTLSSGGALASGLGIINLTFPNNTFVPNSIVASNITVNGTPCTNVATDPATRQVMITTPVSLSNGQAFSVVINSGAGLLNPTSVGAYQLNASTSAQPAQATSPNYSTITATTTVTPATISLSASEPDSCTNYTIAFNLGAQGRLLSGVSTMTLTFNAGTTIANGGLSGVLVNGVAASAAGNNTNKTISLTTPSAVSLSNNAAVTLYLPGPAICNPSVVNNYTLTVATSVETTPVTSNSYKIIGRVVVGDVTVNPAFASTNAIYTIPLTLSSNGAMIAGSDGISFRFPAGTTVPNGIVASQIKVNGTAATTATSNSVTREVTVTTPVNLVNSQNFSVVFELGAGLINPPAAGDYTLQAWTSVQPTPVTSPIYSLSPSQGANPISLTTKDGYKKSNQGKVFYHDTQWWAIAHEEPENKWYIWKFNGTTWTKSLGMDKGTSSYYDAVVNSSANKLYLFVSHKSTPKFRRYSYIGGAWKNDTGFPVTMNDFIDANGNNPVSLGRAKNGDLWIFRIHAGILQAKRSSDDGVTWSTVINVKTGLHTAFGTTDAVAFTSGGNDYIGVGYAETDTVSSRFGFLHHQNGAADNAWTDESASLTLFGTERALNKISMTSDANNNVYLFTQNIGGTGSDPNNTLYKRSSAGAWTKFKINTSPKIWKTPALAIDATGGVLYVMGVNTTTKLGEYKSCNLGQEATLETASANGLFDTAGGAFEDMSAPAANLTAASGLLVTADNTAAKDTYYRFIDLGGSTPLIVGAASVVSNQINANATYTVPLQLSGLGGLDAGSGTLNFIFPNNTFVPNNMPPAAVKVDGVPAASVTSNSTTRQVSVVTPVNLPNNHSFSVVFDSASGAGLLNSTTIGAAYRLTCWSSAQPTQVKSPAFSLVQTTTKVTPALVTPFSSDPDSLADYTLNFNLGGHGRPLGGSSAIKIKFNALTKVSNGSISGVKLNTKDAAATADSILRQVTVTIPTGLSLTNNSAIALVIPRAKVRNPNVAGFHTLMASTSVETTFVTSQPFEIKTSNLIGRPIPGTKKSFDRNNQGKLFHHAGFWWVTAHSKTDSKWYLWKFDGVSWTQNTLINIVGKTRPDCLLDGPNNKVYILLPGSSTTTITRLSYAAGAWSVDAGYPYNIADFAQISDGGVNLIRAKNGDFWVFRGADSTIYAKRSSDAGQTWAPTVAIKKHLNNKEALTDAVAFTTSGSNHVGVGYAENSAPGSIYGFLRHKDSDPDSIWTDETAAIPQLTGTTSDDHISASALSGEVLMIIKTNGGGGSVTNVGLLRRTVAGVWSQHPILLSTGWTRPLMAIDQSNNRLYVFGTREDDVKVGEMKQCAIGDYASLLSAPIDTVFKNDADDFFDGSVAAHTVSSTTNLMVCNGNDTRDELWYNLIPLGGAPKMQEAASTGAAAPAEEDFDGVQVNPNPFNPQTSFRFKVKEPAPVKLQIFNLTGQLVRTIIDEQLAPGIHQRRWNGRNQNGRPAASGVYFYRLQIGPKIFNGRIQMVK